MKLRRTLLLFLAAVALATQAAPGRADAEWQDPEGDATALPGVESTPRPSDAELDILSSNFKVSGDSIVATTRLAKLGVAVGSGGSVFQYRFKHKDVGYYFQGLTGSAEYQQLFLNNPRFYRVNPDPAGDDEELKCDCKFATDPKTNSAIFTIKTAAVAKPLKVAAGGIEVGGLEVRTYRRARNYFDADISAAPDSLKFNA